MSDNEEYPDDNEDNNGPPNKKRKLGNDSFMAIENEAEDDDEDGDGDDDDEEDEDSDLNTNTDGHGHAMMPEEDDLDGFIAHEDEVEEELEDERRHKRHKRRRKKKRRHRNPRISEDTLRMLAESRGETYRPDIDIDAGLEDESDGQSDDSDTGGTRRKLKKLAIFYNL